MNVSPKFAAVVIVASIAFSIYEARRASRFEAELSALSREKAELAERIPELTRERDRNASELTTLREQLLQESRSFSGQPSRRGGSQESARAAGDSADSAAAAWLAKVKQLQQRLDDSPQAKIPELRFLSSFDWVELVHDARLETDADYRKALGEVRKRAEGYFTKQFQSALKNYMAANDGQWPADLDQLKAYFDPPVEDAVLDRWHIVATCSSAARAFSWTSFIARKVRAFYGSTACCFGRCA